MPARVLVVDCEPGFLSAAETALQAAEVDVAVCDDSMTALTLLETAKVIELLVTCVVFPKGQPHAIAVAKMARLKRPDVKVLFIGGPEHEPHTKGFGEFMAVPVAIPALVDTVRRMLA
jgi:DNA-binding NtrC family response regulator